MKVAVGNDHAGYPAKDLVLEFLRKSGIAYEYCGSDSPDSVDFPQVTRRVCAHVTSGRVDRAILVCGTGVGASMAANKLAGIRAVVGHDLFSARQGVEHDDANVLCLGAWIVGAEIIRLSIGAFLDARFSTHPDFRRRVAMLNDMDAQRAGLRDEYPKVE